MANQKFYHYLYLLRRGTEEESKGALFSLKELEGNNEVSEEEILKVFDEAEDAVTLDYSIGAIERMKIKKGYPLLNQIYLESNNPLILQSLLETFLKLNKDDFLNAVLKRLEKPMSNVKKKKNTGSIMETLFDEEFILDQILITSLKYIQIHGNPKLKKLILPYLNHPDKKVRWNALVTLDNIGVKLDNKTLMKIKHENKDVLIREQVNIILDKNAAL